MKQLSFFDAEHDADLAAKKCISSRSIPIDPEAKQAIASKLARSTDPETSHEAAAAIEASGVAGRQRAACLQYVRLYPGKTAAEIAVGTGMERHAPSRRLPELRPKWVRNGEARVCEVTDSKSLTWYPVR